MPSYTADKSYIGWLKTMATWNHGNAKAETADILPSDPLIYQSFKEPVAVAEQRGDANDLVGNYHTTIYEPGSLTETYYLQTGRLLYPALGVCTSSGAVAEITTVLCTTMALSVENSTFHFWVIGAAGALTEYYVWINKGTGVAPTETGTAIEADISLSTTAIDVAEVIDGLIAAKDDVGAENGGTATITITNAQLGGVPDCCSSEGTSTGYTITVTTQGTTTHAITKRTSQTPPYCGRHSEQVNETAAESYITDMLSLLLKSYHAECSEKRTKAIQTVKWRWMKSLVDGACDTITKPTALTDNNFDWNNFSFPIFTYGGETLEASILGWSFDVSNTIDWYGLSSGVYTVGEMQKYEDISVTLAIIPTGRNCRELIRTALESYATDLDLTVKVSRDVTTDYIQWTHDKLYMNPYDIVPGHMKGWKEGYFLTMHQLGGTSLGSLAIEVKDNYNDNYYENP